MAVDCGPSPVHDPKPIEPAPRAAPPRKTIWRSVRRPLARSTLAKSALASLVSALMRFVDLTNPRVAGSGDPAVALPAATPAIYAFWHGQHLMYPALNPRTNPVVAMFSRSADAELNAMVGEKFGLEIVRGSGGRVREKAGEKGGARALIALKKALGQGKSVAMIADIPHGTPRQAGPGIVTLAKLSGRPILPMAYATSRRKVIEKSWDKTTINLPFGRSAIAFGDPIHVAADASEAELEAARRAVTAGLDAVTDKAYRMADRKA